MNVLEIIECLEKYKKDEFKSQFLSDTIDYFKKLNKETINKIEDTEHMLAGVKIYLLYNDYYFYLTDKYYKTKYCYRKLVFTDNQINNLVKQICAVKKEKDICDCLKESREKGTFYLLISKNKIDEEANNLVPKDINYSLLGINSLIFLEHQNIARYCELYQEQKNKIQLYDEVDKYIKVYNKLTNLEKDRILLHSGIIYQFLGTIYSNDVDILIIAKKNDEYDKYKNTFEKFDVSSIILPNKNLMDYKYKKEWFTYKLPRLGGADDIYTMLINPKYHFYYRGIKCIDIFTNINKSISRSHPESIVDVYLLKLYNNIIVEMCMKDLSIRQGRIFVIVDKLDLIYNRARKLLKMWYNIDVPIQYLKEHFKRCSELHNAIYKNVVSFVDPLIKEQIKVHRMISQIYIEKYSKGINSLLDIGSGKLSGAQFYSKLKIKKVYAIEPSIYSIEHAKKEVNKYKEVNFKLIQGYGNKEFKLNVKFEVITFIFTIHYMIENIDIVIDNILNHSKTGTKIIITCINGNKLLNNIKDIGRNNTGYEIKYKKDVYWGAYKIENIDCKKQMIFYMKDVYGLENGSIENLVNLDELINKFEKNGIKLLENLSFIDVYNNNSLLKKKFYLKFFQKDILNMNNVLIFTKL